MKIPNQPTIEVKGSRIDAKAVSAIRRASRGDVVRILISKRIRPQTPRIF